MELSYIPLAPVEFPIEIILELDGTNYNIEFRYNDVNNFFTILIKDSDDNELYSSRIKYLTDIIHVTTANLLVTSLLKAFDVVDLLSEKTKEIVVDRDTLGDTVQLYVIP